MIDDLWRDLVLHSLLQPSLSNVPIYPIFQFFDLSQGTITYCHYFFERADSGASQCL